MGTYARFKPPSIHDKIIKAQWDVRKSVATNMANMGLQPTPNNTICSKSSVEQMISSITDGTGTFPDTTTQITASKAASKAAELFDIPESDVIPKKTKALRMLPVSISDQKYMCKLLEKYGNDYQQMSRDIKLNDMQHTEGQLKKLGSRFLLLNKDQIRVDIPQNIQHLMC